MIMVRKRISSATQRLPENTRVLGQTTILALAAGLVSVAFLFCTNFLFERTFLAFANRSKAYFAAASLLVILGFSFLVSLLLRFVSPDAAGSGIPQLKAAYWKEMGEVAPKSVAVKFVAGILSIAGGNSLGREGPSVFIGGGASSNLAGLLGVPRRERREASVVGAAAGLAAAFNTPLAAITFVIEEIIGDFNSRYLGRVILASVLGAMAVHALLGRQPAFSLPAVDRVGWTHYLVVPFAAGLAALSGQTFQKLMLRLRGRLRGEARRSDWLLPLAGGFLTWVIGVTVFWFTGHIGIFGLGYGDLSAALNDRFPWAIAGVMVLAKLAATVIGYGFGGSGGIFAPALFIGGMAGFFTAGLAGLWLPLTGADRIVLAAVGMSACLGTIVRAPLTSVLIVFEMTHQFELVPGLMIGLIISQAVAKLAGGHNLYDALLVQDGHELHKIRPPIDLQGWQNLPVRAVANPKPVFLTSFDLSALKALIERYPFHTFPILQDGRLAGLTTREEIERAIQTGDPPEIRPAVTCMLDETIREIGDRFIEAAVPVLIVADQKNGDVRGIITLHDLIRAQAAVRQ
jgi:chloride channel protein, CIC family